MCASDDGVVRVGGNGGEGGVRGRSRGMREKKRRRRRETRVRVRQVDFPDPSVVVCATGREVAHVGREKYACYVGAVCHEGAYGD